MFAIMGITGHVGSAAAKALLEQGKSVRAIVRDTEKAKTWADRGAEIAVADYGDAGALKSAFTNVEGVFVMIPPYFAPEKDFPEARAVVAALHQALAEAKPPKAVYLSSVGGHQTKGRVDHATPHLGAGTRLPTNSECISETGLVHGKFAMGRRTCPRKERTTVFPATA